MERQKKESNFQNSIRLRVMRNAYARRIPEEGTPLFGSAETVRFFYFTLFVKANLPSDDCFHINGSYSFVGIFRGYRARYFVAIFTRVGHVFMTLRKMSKRGHGDSRALEK